MQFLQGLAAAPVQRAALMLASEGKCPVGPEYALQAHLLLLRELTTFFLCISSLQISVDE